jgi:hypothetical protein
MSKIGTKLVLGILAAALSAGLLTSVFVRPQAALTASSECYGPCPTATELFVSPEFVRYGQEELVRFEVMVRPDGHESGVPTGQVAVVSGKKVLCRVHLSFGRGVCSPHSHALKPGVHVIVAEYKGKKGFASSTSPEKGLVVLRHSFFF